MCLKRGITIASWISHVIDSFRQSVLAMVHGFNWIMRLIWGPHNGPQNNLCFFNNFFFFFHLYILTFHRDDTWKLETAFLLPHMLVLVFYLHIISKATVQFPFFFFFGCLTVFFMLYLLYDHDFYLILVSQTSSPTIVKHFQKKESLITSLSLFFSFFFSFIYLF